MIHLHTKIPASIIHARLKALKLEKDYLIQSHDNGYAIMLNYHLASMAESNITNVANWCYHQHLSFGDRIDGEYVPIMSPQVLEISLRKDLIKNATCAKCLVQTIIGLLEDNIILDVPGKRIKNMPNFPSVL